MFRIIVRYGLIAGLIVAVPMILMMTKVIPEPPHGYGTLFGYLTMIVALTAVFLGIKHCRDTVGSRRHHWQAITPAFVVAQLHCRGQVGRFEMA